MEIKTADKPRRNRHTGLQAWRQHTHRHDTHTHTHTHTHTPCTATDPQRGTSHRNVRLRSSSTSERWFRPQNVRRGSNTNSSCRSPSMSSVVEHILHFSSGTPLSAEHPICLQIGKNAHFVLQTG
jgi:hypothetical protein